MTTATPQAAPRRPRKSTRAPAAGRGASAPATARATASPCRRWAGWTSRRPPPSLCSCAQQSCRFHRRRRRSHSPLLLHAAPIVAPSCAPADESVRRSSQAPGRDARPRRRSLWRRPSAGAHGRARIRLDPPDGLADHLLVARLRAFFQLRLSGEAAQSGRHQRCGGCWWLIYFFCLILLLTLHFIIYLRVA